MKDHLHTPSLKAQAGAIVDMNEGKRALPSPKILDCDWTNVSVELKLDSTNILP
jgi:hypothetical protein